MSSVTTNNHTQTNIYTYARERKKGKPWTEIGFHRPRDVTERRPDGIHCSPLFDSFDFFRLFFSPRFGHTFFFFFYYFANFLTPSLSSARIFIFVPILLFWVLATASAT